MLMGWRGWFAVFAKVNEDVYSLGERLPLSLHPLLRKSDLVRVHLESILRGTSEKNRQRHRPALVQRRRHLRDSRPRLHGLECGRHRGLPGADVEARLSAGPGCYVSVA